MKLMDKYLLREYLVPVSYCLIAFCMAQVICDLLSHLSKFLEADASIKLILTYYLFHLGPTLEYLMPASLLLATLYTLWQLTRHNELTAMRSSGVSLTRIILPFLAIGIIFSIAASVIKEQFAPNANRWASKMRRNKFSQTESKGSDLKNVHYMNNYIRNEWRIDELNTDTPSRLKGVKIKKHREDGSTFCMISAKRAERLDGSWWLFEGIIQDCNLDEFPTNTTGISEYGIEMRDLHAKPGAFVVSQWPEEVLSLFLSADEMKDFIRTIPETETKKIARFTTDMHNRLAVPWACLIAVMLGIPAGSKSGRGSALTGIFLAISLFFIFYAVSQTGLFLAKRELIWPWLGAWFSNIIFTGLGFVMVSKMK